MHQNGSGLLCHRDKKYLSNQEKCKEWQKNKAKHIVGCVFLKEIHNINSISKTKYFNETMRSEKDNVKS